MLIERCRFRTKKQSEIEPWFEGILYGFFRESSINGNSKVFALVRVDSDESKPMRLWDWETNLIIINDTEKDT